MDKLQGPYSDPFDVDLPTEIYEGYRRRALIDHVTVNQLMGRVLAEYLDDVHKSDTVD
jgi:hypothetical protein